MSTRYGIALLAALGSCSTWDAAAQSASNSYAQPRLSIDSGAARATSPSFDLSGSLGQADAETPASSASYALQGGFHRRVSPNLPSPLFSDGFEGAPPMPDEPSTLSVPTATAAPFED